MRRQRHKLSVAQQAGLARLGETSHSRFAEFARLWGFTHDNGITAGLHNKMEVLQRLTYSFRNFQHYRLQIKVMSSLVRSAKPRFGSPSATQKRIRERRNSVGALSPGC
jgi:hypothetical protein